MVDRSRRLPDESVPRLESLPEDLADGATVLVQADGSPSEGAVCLRLLAQHGRADDTALVVTTTESADATTEAYESLADAATTPSLGLVDSVSEQQSISAPYEATPVVYTPAQGDLERLVLALSELSGRRPPAIGARHLVVRSLTPILEASSMDAVAAVLERITGLRSHAGLCLLGVDGTAHDGATVQRLREQVDGVCRVRGTGTGGTTVEYQSPAGGSNGPRSGRDGDD